MVFGAIHESVACVTKLQLSIGTLGQYFESNIQFSNIKQEFKPRVGCVIESVFAASEINCSRNSIHTVLYRMMGGKR